MKLIGRYMSPFVRRVGVSLHLLDIPFSNEPLSVLTDSLKIREYSPLGRVPALVLDDGRVLIDSNAILDHFDQQAGAERALLPLSGAERSEAMNLLAFAVGACEKTVAAYYERDRRPEGLGHIAVDSGLPVFRSSAPVQFRFGGLTMEKIKSLSKLAAALVAVSIILTLCAPDRRRVEGDFQTIQEPKG